jgi:RND family efflux transporter MFP subunit
MRETTLVQAPGWIEPAPYATAVPALTDGVIREVLALEGQTVQAGEVIARLIDDDARLALKKAEAVLAERGAAAAQAAAMHEAAEARAAEIRDELRRKRDLSNDGTFAEATVARLELRLRGLEADVAAAAAGERAAVAAMHIAEVEVELASLALARTEIRAPISGVVLSRSIEPGTRLTMAGPGPGEAHESGVVRIYDPSSLQVRVDVPLADAANVGIGAAARIVSESLPETTFSGTISRVVHEANIQRNTVQFKVSIENPAAALKPEMLVRVRIMGSTSSSAGGVHESTGENEPGSGVLLPELAVQQTGEGRGTAWMVAHDARGRTIAMRRELRLGSRHADGYIEVVSGAAPTDRAIVNPPAGLANGTRVRIVGEAASKPEESP